MPKFISISGNCASGKSTLAKSLQNLLGWSLLPKERPEMRYLVDQFTDPQRWSFETQVRFLANKASSIRNEYYRNHNIILDRTIYEDMLFARKFYKDHKMDNRAFDTYSDIAQIFNSIIPVPDMILFCFASYNMCQQRFNMREKRPFEKLYPENHIESLEEMLLEWIKKVDLCPVYMVDTEKYDIRDRGTMEGLLSDIMSLYNRNEGYQMSLFNSFYDNSDEGFNILELVNNVPFVSSEGIEETASVNTFESGKTAYIAAPFTQYAELLSSSQMNLFSTNRPHGIISPKSSYRKNLLKISTAVEKLGFKAILPHRDINMWGNEVKGSSEIVEACHEAISGCSLFIGILGNSLGCHLEVGMAMAYNKPLIILEIANMPASFFVEGISNRSNAIIYKVGSIARAERVFDNESTLIFLRDQKLI